MQYSAAERTPLRTPVCPLFATRLAGTDYTPHIDPALLRAIIAAYDGARAGAQPLKMPRVKMLQIAQYCAALPWMMGVARQADSMQSAFVRCGFREVAAGTWPSLTGILNTLVRACARMRESEVLNALPVLFSCFRHQRMHESA